MEERKRVAVIGGDARQTAAGRALARAGYEVCGAEEVARADYILLPLPLDEARTPLAALLRAAAFFSSEAAAETPAAARKLRRVIFFISKSS